MNTFSTLLKTQVKRMLRKTGRHLTYIAPGTVTGFDLANDLSLLLKVSSPIIFDVGANIGQSIELFLQAAPKSRIYSFEPTPHLYNDLLSRYRTNKNIYIFNSAVGDQCGTTAFHQYDSSVLNSVLPLDDCQDNRFRGSSLTTVHTVSVTTIDNVTDALALDTIDLLKIDTQGFDLRVLKGALKTLSSKRVTYILVELNFVPMYIAQASALEICQFLSDQDYSIVDFYEKHRQASRLAWCTALFERTVQD